MPSLTPETQQYLDGLMPSGDPILREMEEVAEGNGFPIIGSLCGRVLFQIAIMTRAKRIFEMGSGYGYSTYWFAKALPEDGEIHHTEGSQENSELAREYLTRGGLVDKVRFHVGDALKALPSVPGQFDVILVDVAKRQYPQCHKLAVDRLRPGGVMVTDNVLWHDKAADKSADDPTTEAIREFTQLQLSDDRLCSMILPIRDGLQVSVRI